MMRATVSCSNTLTSVCEDVLRHAGVGADWDGVTMRLPWLYTPTIPLQLFTLHVGAGQNQNQNGCTRRASAQAGARHRLSTSARPRATRAHRPSSCRARRSPRAASRACARRQHTCRRAASGTARVRAVAIVGQTWGLHRHRPAGNAHGEAQAAAR